MKEIKEEKSLSEAENEGMRNFVSPIANPLIEGRNFERAVKLLKKTISYNQEVGSKETPKPGGRQLKRGVVEVTKALRKNEKGIVFMASDVHPVDIMAHLPVLCEDKGVLYCFVGSKNVLGQAVKVKRPTSVVMVCEPRKDFPTFELYGRFKESLIKHHPYF